MNALRLMLPKDRVDYLYADCPLEEAMILFAKSGFSAVPIIEQNGEYMGTVCDKDFLKCYTLPEYKEKMNKLSLGDIITKDWNPAINVL